MAKLTSLSEYYRERKEPHKLTSLKEQTNTGSGLGYVAASLGLGTLGILEGGANLFAGGISSLFGGEEGKKYAKYLFTHDKTSGLTQKLNEAYNPGKVMQFAGEAAQGIGQSSVFYLDAAVPFAGTTLFFAGAIGNSVGEAAKQTGELGWKEYGYGFTSGAIEGALEKLSGAAGAGIGMAGKTITGKVSTALGKLSKDTATSAVRNGIAKSIISGAAGEFFEEFLGAYADTAAQHVFQIDPNAEYSFSDAVYAGLVGAASGGIMEGVQTSVRATFDHARGTKIINNGKAQNLVNTAKVMQDEFKSADWSKYAGDEKATGVMNDLIAAYQAYQKLDESQKTGDRARVYLGEMESNLAVLEAAVGAMRMQDDIRAHAENYVDWVSRFKNEKFTAEDIRNNRDDVLRLLAAARWANQFSNQYFEGAETIGQRKERWVQEQIAAQAAKRTAEATGEPAAPVASSILSTAGTTDSGIEWSENTDGGITTRIYDLGGDRSVYAEQHEDGTWVLIAGAGESLLDEDGVNLATRVKTENLDKTVTEIRNNYDTLISDAEKRAAEQVENGSEQVENKAESGQKVQNEKKAETAPKTGNVVKGLSSVQYAGEADLKRLAGFSAEEAAKRTIKSNLTLKQKATAILLGKWFEHSGYKLMLYKGTGTGATGAYRAGHIFLDINASMLQIVAHELTHSFVRKSPALYGQLRQFVIDREFGGDETKLNEAVKNITDLYKKNGTVLEREDAIEEIVAKSCEKVFGSVAALKELFGKNKQLFKEANSFLHSMEVTFQSVYDGYGEGNEYARAMEEDITALHELREKFAEALQEAMKDETAGENEAEKKLFREINKADDLGVGEIWRDENGDLTVAQNVDGDKTFFSITTYEEYGRRKLAEVLKENGFGKEDIRATLSSIDRMSEFLEDLADRYQDTYGQLKGNLYATLATDITGTRQVLSTLVKNGEYPVNLDLQLICKKRVAYMKLMARLLDDGVFGKVKYDGEAIAKVNQILSARGYETACLGCFVESRRQQLQKWAETIAQEWNDEVRRVNKDAGYFPFVSDSSAEISGEELMQVMQEYEGKAKNDKGNLNLGRGGVKTKMGKLLSQIPSLAHLITADTLLTPDGLKAIRRTAGGGDMLSLIKQRYGAASPKLVQEFNPYNSEIADLSFQSAKKITGDGITGAGEYEKAAKEKLAASEPKKQKGESDSDFRARKQAWDSKVTDLAMTNYLYDIGGARIQSFSDFMIENVFDYFQIMGDLAARGFPLHGYTKEIVCARLFGQTGAKWNGSLIAHVTKNTDVPAGLMTEAEYEELKVNGKIPAGLEAIRLEGTGGRVWYMGFDDYARHAADKDAFIQSIGMKDIMALVLDPRYSGNVGNITIGVSDEQIIAMLRSPYFRMAIPYHASGMLPEFAKQVGTDRYTDYTKYQNTRIGQLYDFDRHAVDSLAGIRTGEAAEEEIDEEVETKGKKKKKKKKQLKTDLAGYNFNARLREVGDAKKVADEYIDWCRNHLHPVYVDGDLVGYATYLPKFSGSEDGKYYDFTQEENYYKLLEDFDVYNAIDELSGKKTPAPQGPVNMILPGEGKGRDLTKTELDEYRQRLSDVGIYSKSDIDKIIERANWTTEQIIEHELASRSEYQKYADANWEDTVAAVEDALQTRSREDDFKTYKQFENMREKRPESLVNYEPVKGTYKVDADKTKLSFVGENSNVDKTPLQRAIEMENSEEFEDDPWTIREETGWFRGPDGKWRFEIDDRNASLDKANRDRVARKKYETEGDRIDKLATRGEITESKASQLNADNQKTYSDYKDRKIGTFQLQDILKHDKLFEAYPQLRTLTVEYAELPRGVSGQYNTQRDVIQLNSTRSDEQTFSSLLHEIQHYIQAVEGYARGANVNEWAVNAFNYYTRHVNALVDRYAKKALNEIFEIDSRDARTAREYFESLLRWYMFRDQDPDNRPSREYVAEDARLHGWEKQLETLEREAALHKADLARIRESLKDKYKQEPAELYRATVGEMEARDVQARKLYTDEERRKTMPALNDPAERRKMVFAGDAESFDFTKVRYSYPEDADGDSLSDSQIMFFGNSKIRDEEGKLIKVYHGTDADFTVFDRAKGRSNMDIQGSFFSPWEIDAAGYGPNVRAFYLNITNPAPEGVAYKVLNRYKGQNNAGIKAREALERMGYDGVNNSDEEYIAFYPEQIKLVDNTTPTEDEDVRYSIVSDKDTLAALNSGETMMVYRAMQVIDGKLYPPMAAKLKSEDGKKQLVEPTEIGTWYQADEHPELIRNGKFTLDKANGSAIEAAYNPYFHTSTTPLNDQFSSAYKRDNLVTVEGEVPVSELTSGYKAQFAKDPVGMMNWHNGPVAGKLKGEKARKVILSRYFKANRIVPDSEVADVVAKTLEGEDIRFPYNVVTPQLRSELEKRGVKIEGARYNIEEDSVGKYVNVNRDQDIFAGKEDKDYPSIINKYMRKHFRGVYPIADDRAFVGRKGIDEYSHPARRNLSSNLYNAKAQAGTELDNLLAVSSYERHSDDDGRHPEAIGGWDYYTTVFKVGNDFYQGEVAIMLRENGREFYDITKIKEIDRYADQSEKSPVDWSTANLNDNSISQPGDSVNTDPTKKSVSEEKRGYTAEEQDEARKYVENYDLLMPDGRRSVMEFLKSAKGTKVDKDTLKVISNIIAVSDNLDVRFADTEQKGVFIRGKSGQQLILLDSKLESAEAIRKTLSAEMIHMAEEGGEGYEKFARLVLAVTPPDRQEEVEKKYRDFWKQSGKEITDEALLHECVSELGAEMIEDYDLVEKWAARDKTFVGKLLASARSLARSLFGKNREAYRQASRMTTLLAEAIAGSDGRRGKAQISYELRGQKTADERKRRADLQDQARVVHYFTKPRAREILTGYMTERIAPYFTEGSDLNISEEMQRDFTAPAAEIPKNAKLKIRGLDAITDKFYRAFYTADTSKKAREAASDIAADLLDRVVFEGTDTRAVEAIKTRNAGIAATVRRGISDAVYDALTGGEAISEIDKVRTRYDNLATRILREAGVREARLQEEIANARGETRSMLQAIEQISRARRQFKEGNYRYQGTLAAPEMRLLSDAVISAKTRGGFLDPEKARRALIAFNEVFRIDELKSDLNEEYEVLGMNVDTLKDLDYLVSRMVSDYDTKRDDLMKAPLTQTEIETFADVARAVAQLYRTYNRYYDERRKAWIDADETAKRGIENVEQTMKLQQTDPKIVQTMRKIMNDYGIELLDPLAVSKLLDGYAEDGVMTEIITDIMNAENAKTLRIQNYMREVDEFIKSTKGFEKHLTDENDMIEYRGQKLTRDEFIQLYMTTFRKQALLHLGLGRMEFGTNGSKYGMRVIAPFLQVVENATGSTDKVDTPSIEDLQSESQKVVSEIRELGRKVLTADDKKYIELMEKFYNEVSTKDKAETDYKYFGMTNVIEDDTDKYVPIVTSSSSRASSITDERTAMLDFATLSGQSFNKNTIKGAKNPLSITGAYGLMQKHANGLAAYVELYAPMQKLDRIWSTDINHNKQDSKRLRDTIKNAYGNRTEDYIRTLMGDIQGINKRKPNAFNSILAKLRSNYAIFQLGANPKTWFNQLGSMGALYRFCDFDSIMKGIKPTNLGDMSKFSTAAAIREDSDVAVKAQSLTENVSGKVKDIMMKPIGWSDMKIVGMSWGACQYQIQKEKGYAVGSEANMKAAGELLNKVINESQDTSMASTKTGIARSDNEIIRSLAMFRSAPFKQYSRMTDAIGTLTMLNAKKKAGIDVSDDAIRNAKKELARTGAAWALQAAIGVAITSLFHWLYDKDDEIKTKDVAIDFASEMLAVVPILGDAVGYFASGYDMSLWAFDIMNDGMQSISGTAKLIGRSINGDNISRQDINKQIYTDAQALGEITGIPVRNVKNALFGLTKRASSLLGSSIGYELDATMYKKSYQADLQKAIESGNDALAEKIVELLYADKKTTTEASEAAVSEIVRLYGEGFTDALPPTLSDTITVDGVEYTVNAKDQKRIRSIANEADPAVVSMIGSKIYKGLEDSEKAKAIKDLYRLYYDRALADVYGKEMTKNDALTKLTDPETLIAASAHIAGISADKNADGKSISGSRKTKVLEYLNSLDIDDETAYLILYAAGYSSQDLQKEVSNIAATAPLDTDTYTEVFAALGLGSIG